MNNENLFGRILATLAISLIPFLIIKFVFPGYTISHILTLIFGIFLSSVFWFNNKQQVQKIQNDNVENKDVIKIKLKDGESLKVDKKHKVVKAGETEIPFKEINEKTVLISFDTEDE